jgi:hypothetical protein
LHLEYERSGLLMNRQPRRHLVRFVPPTCQIIVRRSTGIVFC